MVFFLRYVYSISKAAARGTNIIIKRPHRGNIKIKSKKKTTGEKHSKSSRERTKTQQQAAAALTWLPVFYSAIKSIVCKPQVHSTWNRQKCNGEWWQLTSEPTLYSSQHSFVHLLCWILVFNFFLFFFFFFPDFRGTWAAEELYQKCSTGESVWVFGGRNLFGSLKRGDTLCLSAMQPNIYDSDDSGYCQLSCKAMAKYDVHRLNYQ